MITLLILAALAIGGMIMSAGFMWLVARCIKVPNATASRVCLASAVLLGINTPLVIFLFGFNVSFSTAKLTCIALGAAQVCLAVVAVKHVFDAGLKQVLALLLATTFLQSLVMEPFVIFVLRPYLVEAFSSRTNQMAPTLLGWHRTGACPHCGEKTFARGAPPDEDPDLTPQDPVPAICNSCLQTAPVEDVVTTVSPPDGFVVNKFLKPRRWDIVLFKHPNQSFPRTIMRIVGLPGETVSIRNGFVWVDNVKQSPPEMIAELRYLAGDELEGEPVPSFEFRVGIESAPWELGDDEYIVLGDFSARSLDSRFWGSISGDSIEGVVTVLYKPLNRFATFR